LLQAVEAQDALRLMAALAVEAMEVKKVADFQQVEPQILVAAVEALIIIHKIMAGLEAVELLL
jgi:hypothetical protein